MLIAKEAESLHLAREIEALEAGRVLELEPQLRRAREENAAARAKTDRVRHERGREERLEHLAWKAGELEREVRELRASWSWRVTAPLRRIFEWLGGGRR